MYRTCTDCGKGFHADESWKVRCIDCWRRWKNRKEQGSRNQDTDTFFQLLKAKMRIQELENEIQRLDSEKLDRMFFGNGKNLETELVERMRTLLSLVHPDKHGGSQAANDVTVWLLDIKEKAASFGEHGAA